MSTSVEAPGDIEQRTGVIPHVVELLADELTPVGAYRRLRTEGQPSFLFESITGGEQVSRYSLLGVGPRERLRLYPDRLEVDAAGHRETVTEAPLAALRRRLERMQVPDLDPMLGDLPFVGGFVGFFGWDLVRSLEHLPDQPPSPFDLPIAELGRFDVAVIFDHAHQRLILVSNEIEGEVDSAAAVRALEDVQRRLAQPAETHPATLPKELPKEQLTPAEVGPPSLSADQYRHAVERAKDYIRAGDIFQVVLARRWEIETRAEPLQLYRALRTVNPSPYMVLMETPEVALVGGSPEMLVRAVGGRFEMRPIAGTRPRGQTLEEDQRLAAEMLDDPKEVAEHVMLVDLGRNDLGRVAAPASVHVPVFQEVEHYSHVMHIVSSVLADRGSGRTALDALFACFPAGTLSGAPKIRAMEIIDELEPESRGVYGGAIGYLSYSGDLDTCIAIRTLVVEPERVTITAGAGIVADSDPEREEEETRNKAAALLQAVALAGKLEP